ncbi:hypothetical protein R5R35_012826 [Gryllus longicercus]|uniref:Kinesin motor domain-containing protein n=1 Tax=Gryllus longicercus TaxID=2509291 RepID=A0AAN9VDQ1_9ORTH
MADSVSVQVALRIRPLVDSEIKKGCQMCLECVPNEPQVFVKGTDKSFTFNHVFNPEDNEYFYDVAIKDLVHHAFKGYNVTVLAYGQTGSGKTFSMGTSYSDENDAGVIPRAVKDIFKNVAEMTDRHFKISVSFMELYQEQLFDLLSSSKSTVDIREDTRGIVIPGLTEVAVFNADDTTQCLVRGSMGRATGATAMNAQSSRSHAIFTITIQQQSKSDESNSMTSKFHLVDLAGSERPKKTKATGERFKEGVNINKGLLALGNVISALGDESQKGYISYRDSRLTRLLQDSLGGNSLTIMIACVSPADYNLEETLSTLRYADRARRIRNKPVVNQDPTAALIAKLKQDLQEAQLELMNLDRNSQCPEEHKRLEEENANLAGKNMKLTEALHNAFAENTNLVERALLAEVARDRMKVKLCELQAEYGNAMDNLNQTMDPSTCPAEFWEQLKHLRDLQEKIKDLQAEQKRSSEEILNHELSADNEQNCETEDNIYTSKIPVDIELQVEHHEAHTLQQVELNKELKELNRALALKEELVAQLAVNSNQILNLKTDYDSAVKDLELQVQFLQKEKEELVRSLQEIQNSTVAPKENEQHKLHTKRLNELEQKITCLNKKIAEQNKMIRMKEQQEKKISQLNNEITSMKQTKVKLIKQMKIESEKFRNWKLQRERELSKLKDQDRKRQNQLVRMERLHTKQQNVWKRKVEEAVAINKRLKDALALQKATQERRGNMSSAMKVQTWLAQELEIIYSIMYAERTLEQLMEDRAVLTEQVTALKKSLDSGKLVEEENEVEEEIKQLEENVAARNAQISDLQQKILDSDQENKSKTRWDYIQSSSEAKCALKYLFDVAVETKREKTFIENKLAELQHECNSKDNTIQEQERTIKELSQNHSQIIRLEKEYEEKIFVLLKHFSGGDSDSSSINVILEQASKRQQRIEELEAMINNKKIEKKKKVNAPPTINNTFVYELEESMNEEDEDDNPEDDPDWQKTPVFKRIRSMIVKKSDEGERSKAVKRTSDGKTKCCCKKGCSTKVCGCYKVDSHCSSACKCSSACRNREQNACNNENVPDNFKKPRELSFFTTDEEF